ncbi:MAG: ATP-binding cassette domain-containing protein, partial [Candidatus Methanomethylophilaceae archaeon]|nr:ATP-binding cassette domain-containing protein [Candidatus Methanomethylophilaceae archaeon]
MDNIIEVRDLVVKFGDFAAVNGISFDVKEGEIFGFLGPNGAGKTTSIRTITTIQKYDSGSVTIDGHDIKTDYLEARKLIGIAQQHISLDKDLTVRQNLKHHAIMHKIPAKELDRTIEEMADILELGDFMDHKVMDLSGGWKRKAAIIGAIIHSPKILLLDEPTAGLDTRSRHMLWELVRKLNSKGTTIFLTTHYIEEAETLCDRVAIIDHGKLIAIGTVDELRDMIGRISVETTWDDGRRRKEYFPSIQEAKEFSQTLGDKLF